MDEARERIEKELDSVMDRLRQLGGVVVVEEFPGAIGDDGPLADPADGAQVRLLLDRANQLAEALERLRKSQYGICEECADAISPARLKAMPEVTTCLRCQDRLERGTQSPAPITAGRPFPPSATP